MNLKSFFLLVFTFVGTVLRAQTPAVLLVKEEFIFDNPPVPSCHASSIVQVGDQHLMATWFGGTAEGKPDVTIWLSEYQKGKWSQPKQMADGIIDANKRYPCWNPVLFKTREGKLMLYYKIGPNPREWWGMVRYSTNNGKTWSAPEKLPDGMLGPIKNKPIQLANGDILHPTSTESVTGNVWHVHLEKTDKNGNNWQKISIDNGNFGAIQPSILTYPDGRMQMLCRSRQNVVVETWSTDGGKTWSPVSATSLPNPNSGTDAVTLKNGTQILIYNPLIRGSDWAKGRNKLRVAASKDGVNWQDIYSLEDEGKGEFSYPAVIQTTDGLVHITYTHERKNVKHVVLKVPDVLPPKPVGPTPSKAQMGWHEMEQNAFIHFTTNTFTDLEWGYGDEKPSIFNPTQTDVEQWIKTLKDAGFKGAILTVKHHDGFCLFPSQYTEHSIKNSPYKNGKGDIVREVADACKKHGLKFGIYLSPWDRNHPEYGKPGYVEYYRNQLKELFTNYGPAFEMWFDGANGGDGYYGGAREKRQIKGSTYYDWPKTLDLVRQMEPNVIFFSDAGPGVRWVGNERGIAGETNWNSITPDTLFAGKGGIEKLLNTGSEDGTQWIPAEVDVSIRPGWFYHAKEDSKVRTPENLFDIYLTSVGRGSTLLLNVPPDRRGLIHENDVKALQGWRAMIDREFKTNLAANAKTKASSFRGNAVYYASANLTDGNKDTYWTTNDDVTTGSVEIDLGKTQTVKYVTLKEYIALGQRVKSFEIEAWQNGTWQKVAQATTIGYKRILKLTPVQTSKIRVNITASKASPVLSAVEVY
ncbi:exo-alpha-sialidase [Runella salmonicolor]|uniref:alpha-L-fucosidase n=1 Tax=Runella salmonicolor TaxID=2950278 RepID=A0ABT1FLW1_9BACT|nr:exo-alpha-sialidase [Runella salmonicolor]MCP1382732.1 exo-alpha-sialidase [Runella salmonicolor]